MSPDGQTIVTGAGDETLRFWNVFYKSRSHKVWKRVGVGVATKRVHFYSLALSP